MEVKSKRKLISDKKMAQGWKKDYTRYKSFFLNVLSAYNTKPNLRIYLELMLSLGTIIIFSIFAIKPTILTIVEINNEIKGKETTIAKLDKKIVDLKTASSILQTQSQNLKIIDEAVPSDAELEKLIKQIESLSSTSTVQLTSLTSAELLLKGKQNEKKKASDLNPLPDNPNELPISFSVSGDYPNLFSFLKSVENLRRPLKFDTFIFNTSKSTEDRKLITLTISGRVPFIITEIENEK